MGKFDKSIGAPIGAFLLLLLGAIVYAACLWGDIDAEEIQRVPSPDGVFEAVALRRSGGGATVGASWNVYLVKSGERVQKGAKNVLWAQSVDGLELVWTAPRFLEIRYAKARIFGHSNFWYWQESSRRFVGVEIRLAPKSPRSWS